MSDKCPDCGAEVDQREGQGWQFICGSWASDWAEDDEEPLFTVGTACLTRQLEQKDAEIIDHENDWGKITLHLNLPPDASAMKVIEEISKVQKSRNKMGRLAQTALMDCGNEVDRLIERIALIEEEFVK